MADDNKVSPYEESTFYRAASPPRREREPEVSAEELHTSRVRMALGNMRFNMKDEGKLVELIANAPCLDRASFEFPKVKEYAVALHRLGANIPDYSGSGAIAIISDLEIIRTRTESIRKALSAKPRE